MQVEIDQDLVDVLAELHRSVKQAAQLLGRERGDFIRYASAKGIPYLQLTSEELRLEIDTGDKL